jgi:hypothetical protein
VGGIVTSERRLLLTLLVAAAAVLGWTIALELEETWGAAVVIAAALIALAAVWLLPRRNDLGGPIRERNRVRGGRGSPGRAPRTGTE